jgi:hypothetical protein
MPAQSLRTWVYDFFVKYKIYMIRGCIIKK